MTERQRLIQRRGQLFVELFLGDLKPAFAIRAPDEADAEHGYLIGFTNRHGGTNICVVEYKATDRLVASPYPLTASDRARLTHSNVPVLFVVVDVFRNQLFCGWPEDLITASGKPSNRTTIPVTEVNEKVKRDLRRRLSKADLPTAAVA
jgi:hypothetical protein